MVDSRRARRVAPAHAAQVDGRDGVSTREAVELRLESGVIAAPAGDEEQFGLPASRSLVVQPDVGEFRVGHDPRIVAGRD